ncbi:MAG: recombinase family protein, partial [Phycisphaerae bacterium]
MSNTNGLIPKDSSGILHVMMIGRVSTPQQQLSNIEASYAYARGALVGKWDGAIEIKAFGEQASGLRVDRVTILAAYEEIDAGWPDVVLMEDTSRAYRNPRYLIAFVQDCADAGIRVIAPGDNLDTADENWEVTLGAAALRHGLFIPDTRRRVRRTATGAFHKGGMVLRIRFGYRRVSKDDATTGQFGPPGLRLAKVEDYGKPIRHIRDWIVREQPPLDEVVAWLTEQGLPPGPYVKSGRWSVPVLRDLLKDPILWGLRGFRRVKHKCIFKSGKYLREKNATPEEEHFPALAHMTKDEWDELQVA